MASSVWRMVGAAAGLVGGGAVLSYAALAQLPATALLALLGIIVLGAALLETAARPPARPPPTVDAALRERARLALQAMLDQSPTPLVLADAAGLSALNRAARQLFSVDDRLPAPPSALVAAIAAGTSATLVTNGAARTFALAVSDIDGFGRVASLVDIGPDLRVAEATATRELLLVLSHEIMNGMTPIASLAQSATELAAVEAVSPTLREAVATIARRADALATFSAGYRELARLPPPRLAAVSARDLVDDVVRLFAVRWPPGTIDLRTAVVPPDLQLLGDRGQLSIAIGAVLQNAGEACRAGSERATVTVTLRRDDERLRLVIADNGPGVAAADAECIFQPFFTTRSSGSGVGLALARQVFRAHGGDLVLDRQARIGAAFIGTLPCPGRAEAAVADQAVDDA